MTLTVEEEREEKRVFRIIILIFVGVLILLAIFGFTRYIIDPIASKRGWKAPRGEITKFTTDYRKGPL